MGAVPAAIAPLELGARVVNLACTIRAPLRLTTTMQNRFFLYQSHVSRPQGVGFGGDYVVINH